MSLEIWPVFDKKTNKCTCLRSSDGVNWHLPDGTPSPPLDHPDSLVYQDNGGGFAAAVVFALAIAICLFLRWLP